MRLRSIHIIIIIITLLVVVSLLLCSGSLFISEIIPTRTTAITQPSIVELISSQLVKSKFIKLSYPILIPSASGPDAAATTLQSYSLMVLSTCSIELKANGMEHQL